MPGIAHDMNSVSLSSSLLAVVNSKARYAKVVLEPSDAVTPTLDVVEIVNPAAPLADTTTDVVIESVISTDTIMESQGSTDTIMESQGSTDTIMEVQDVATVADDIDPDTLDVVLAPSAEFSAGPAVLMEVDPEPVVERDAIDGANALVDVADPLVAEVPIVDAATTEDIEVEVTAATPNAPVLPNVGFVAMPGSEAEIVDNIYGAFERAAEEPEEVVEPPKEKQRFTPVVEDEEPAENPFDVQVDVSPFGDGATTLDDVEAEVVEDDFDIAPSTKTATDEDLVVTDGYDLTSTFEIHAPVTEVDVDAITASFSADQALRNSSPGLIMNIGAAVAEQDTHFFDVSDGPVIDLSAFDPSRYFTQATDRSPLKDALPKRERASIVEETKQDLSSMAPPVIDFPTISVEPAVEGVKPAETAPVGDAPPQERDARSVLQMLRELAALRDDEQ